MNRVLITGIEGFVGKHLAKQLSEEGWQVIGLHWAAVTEPLPAELYRGDVCDYPAVLSLLEKTRPSSIIHLAGVSSVAASQERVLSTYEVNVLGTIKLLEAIRVLNLPCRILLISSADVYGRSSVGRPLSESDPTLPVSSYALSKLLAEEAGRYYHRSHGMDIVILRPFSHTGPGQTPSFVFPKVAKAIALAERGERPPVVELGNLDIRRDYCDVRDIVRAYSAALARCQGGEVYNVTSGKPILLREMIDYLCTLARKPITVSVSPGLVRQQDIPLLTGSPAKFQTTTGWKPEIPFQKTLADLLEYYRRL